MQRGDDYLLSHLPPPSSPLPDTWRGSTYGGRARRGRVFIRHTQNTSCQKACVHDRGVSRELWCSGATLHLFIFFGHGESDLIGRTREDEMSVAASVWTEKKSVVWWSKKRGFYLVKFACDIFPLTLTLTLTYSRSASSSQTVRLRLNHTWGKINPAMKRGLFQHRRQRVQWFLKKWQLLKKHTSLYIWIISYGIKTVNNVVLY